MKRMAVAIGVIIIFSGCTQTVIQQMTQGTVQNTTNNVAQGTHIDSRIRQVNGKNCIPRMNGGQVSLLKIIQKQIMMAIIENALKKISELKDVEFPKQIQDTCEADARLKYISSLTNQHYYNLHLMNIAILDSIEQTDEVVKIRAAIRDRGNIQDQAEINDLIDEQNEQIMELIKKAKIRDRDRVSEAAGIFNESLFKFTPLVIGWDKEIAEFGQDNIVWALNNFSAMQTALTQLKSIGALIINGKDALRNFLKRNDVSIDKIKAQRKAKEIAKANKKILKESQKEFEKDFNS